ncbi:TadE/TadG family type IV pilus assembly protein [Pseudomonas sp. LRF_L74]|uniref:TadE/TadG family type IV pilus assembly protein n=1 Tax=Pseudomonas sp. LRF_L74 TaxID=3369422 RepID=UPI003F61DA3C
MNNPIRSGRHSQRGAAAIEFALVFVMFFSLFYGAVSYSLPILLVQSLNEASAEAVRRVIAINPAVSNFSALATAETNTVVSQRMSWLPAAFRPYLSSQTTLVNGLLTVRIQYDYGNHPLIPPLLLPGIGKLPDVPATLVSTSTLKLTE